MSVSEVKKSVSRYFDAINNRKLDTWKNILSPKLLIHDVPSNFGSGITGLTNLAQMYISAFPDLAIKIHNVIAENDMASVFYTVSGTHQGTYMGVPATQKKIVFTGMTMFRIDAEGLIAERWNCIDQIPILNQLGVTRSELFGEPIFA